MVYDITNEESFNNLKMWVKSIREECGKQMQMIIIGNKCDLNEERTVDKNKVMEYAKEEKLDYIETSSKTGENIHKAITLLCEKVLDNTDFSNDFSFTLDEATVTKKTKNKCC